VVALEPIVVFGTLNSAARAGLAAVMQLDHGPAPDAGTLSVIGVGAGALEALQFAATEPHRVRALVLVAPSEPPPPTTAEVMVPTLVLVGTRDTPEAIAIARRYRATQKTCYYVLVYDAGAAIDADRPEAFVEIVTDFLQRREAFVLNNESGLINP
jgi:pimeloyl-ACP methyl ester carboxylesterase